MRLKQFMTQDLHTIQVDEPVRYAAQLMKRHGVGALPVLEHGRLAGIITDRAITTSCLAGGHDPLEEGRPPLVEAHDAEGRTYPLVPDDAWLEPVRPDTTVFSRLEFDVAQDASGLELVFDPESNNPMRVEIEEL